MNERIYELRRKAQELAAEAFPGDVPFDPNPNPILWDRIHVSYEKFAELIVRECMDIAYEYDAPKMSGPGMIIANRIETHFGVDETLSTASDSIGNGLADEVVEKRK